MQGLFINGSRPRSKKEVKETVERDSTRISVQATSAFGNEYDGPLDQAPAGRIHFVGPDPYTKRNFYGTIEVSENGSIKVS